MSESKSKNSGSRTKATMQDPLTKDIDHTKFKDTELGRIPQSWKLVKLGEVSVLTKGLTYASSDYADAENGFPFLTLKSILKDGGYSPEGLKYFNGRYEKQHILSTGDVLFANTDLTRDGDVVGSPLYFDGSDFSTVALYSMDLSKLQVDDRKVDSKYLYFFLMTHYAKRYMVNSSAGSTVLHLDTKRVAELKFNVPPIPEQKKIAAILTSVDEVIENTQKQINKLQDLKKATMQNLLTKGIGHTKFKDSPLGRIPHSWKVRKLNSLCSIDSTSLKETTDPNYRFQYIDISSVTTGTIRYPAETIVFSEAPSRARKVIRKGNILIGTVRPNLKAFAYFDANGEDWIASTGFAVLQANQNNDSRFLFNLMLSDNISLQIEKMMIGSNYPAINSSDVKALTCLVPPLPEQKQIASILTSMDDRIEVARSKLSQTQSLKQSLMQDLLAGKVRVSST